MVSEWNQWLVPAPMMIIERPPESIAFCANSRAMRAAATPGTPVMVSCQAGVYSASASSSPLAHCPGRPSRPTPYSASSRSKTVVTIRPSISRTGTPRATSPRPPWPAVSKRGSSTSATSWWWPSRLSAGSRSPSSRFQRPSPSAEKRWPRVPLGTTTCSLARSNIMGLKSACSVAASAVRCSPASLATRNLPGTNAPSSRFSSCTRKGRSVYCLE